MAEPSALIVGGAGYFGARLAEDLSRTHDVTITYRSISPLRRDWITRSGVAALGFDSARDTGFATDRRFDLVVNLAMPGAKEAAADPEAAMARALTTARACGALLDQGRAGRLIQFSSFHAYGGAGAPTYREDTAPTPTHPYGQTHLAAERYFEAHAAADRALVARPTNMIGAPAHGDLGDQAGLIYLDLCRQAARDGRMVLRNDGQSYRDVLPISDAIAAVRLLAGTDAPEWRVFNLAAGQAVTLADIAGAISGAAPVPVPVSYGEGTDSYRSGFEVDISRLRALGWAPSGDISGEAARTMALFAA